MLAEERDSPPHPSTPMGIAFCIHLAVSQHQTVVEPYGWCLACLIKLRQQTWALDWTAPTRFRVWIAEFFLPDDTPLENVPHWTTQVPPHQLDSRELHEAYAAATIAGRHDNDVGLYTPGIKLRPANMMQLGFSRDTVITATTGIECVLWKSIERYAGHGREYHYPETLKHSEEVARSEEKELEATHREEVALDYVPHLATPKIWMHRRRPDGNWKDRIADDHTVTGHNEATVKWPVAYPSIDDAIALMTPGCCMAVADATASFRHHAIPSRLADLWGYRRFPDLAPCRRRFLDFGWTNGPAIAMQLAHEIDRLNRELFNSTSITMVDDTLLIRHAHELAGYPAIKSVDELLDMSLQGHLWMCSYINYQQNHGKLVNDGTTTVWRGLQLCSLHGGMVSVTNARLSWILQDLWLVRQTWIAGQPVTAASLSTVTGRLNFCAPYVWGGRCRLFEFYDALYDLRRLEISLLDDRQRRIACDPTHGLQHRAVGPSVELTSPDDDDLWGVGARRAFSTGDLRYYTESAAKQYDPRRMIEPTPALIALATWWLDNAVERNGIPLHLDDVCPGVWRGQIADTDERLEATSIADCGIGVIAGDAMRDPTQAVGGYFFKLERRRIDYNDVDRQRPIHELELHTQVSAAKELIPLVIATTGQRRIMTRCDNQGMAASINKGTSASYAVTLLIRDLDDISWANKSPIWTRWSPGETMPTADGISRGKVQPRTCDFMFDTARLRQLCIEHNLPEHTLDGWAREDGSNALCSEWCSPSDSFFEKSLEGHNTWVNADFSVVCQALRRYRSEKARAYKKVSATFLVPSRPQDRSWQSLLKGFRLLETIPKGTRGVFWSIPPYRTAWDHTPPPRTRTGPTPFDLQVWRSD